jgi:hypothetical protein
MGTADFTHVPLTDPARVRKLGLIFLAGLGRAVDFINYIMARVHPMNHVRPPGQNHRIIPDHWQARPATRPTGTENIDLNGIVKPRTNANRREFQGLRLPADSPSGGMSHLPKAFETRILFLPVYSRY